MTMVTDFLVKAGGTSLKYNVWNPATKTGTNWARDELDAGHVIIASVKYQPTWAHLTVIKGYVDDATGFYFILNDPYGHYTGGLWGQYNGADAKMTWNAMNAWEMTSFYK